jgi:hypothetical protein
VVVTNQGLLAFARISEENALSPSLPLLEQTIKSLVI